MILSKSFTQISALAFGTALLFSCEQKATVSEEAPAEPIDETYAVQSEKLLFNVDTLYTEFENPWGMTWLSDGTMLVTEKRGEILVFKDDQFTGEKNPRSS